MAEWGTDPNLIMNLFLLQMEIIMLMLKEYDILFEFPTVELKNKFQDIVYQYAIKKEADQPGLITKPGGNLSLLLMLSWGNT